MESGESRREALNYKKIDIHELKIASGNLNKVDYDSSLKMQGEKAKGTAMDVDYTVYKGRYEDENEVYGLEIQIGNSSNGSGEGNLQTIDLYNGAMDTGRDISVHARVWKDIGEGHVECFILSTDGEWFQLGQNYDDEADFGANGNNAREKNIKMEQLDIIDKLDKEDLAELNQMIENVGR